MWVGSVPPSCLLVNADTMLLSLRSRPPVSEAVTEYDRVHVATYVRLLDAAADGASAEEAARVIFGSAGETDAAALLEQHHAHLVRARWLSREGYLRLAGARQRTN